MNKTLSKPYTVMITISVKIRRKGKSRFTEVGKGKHVCTS